MKFTVTSALFPLGDTQYGPIPGSQITAVFDPVGDWGAAQCIGNDVFSGYRQMMGEGNPLVTLKESDPEIHRVKEAINLFFAFMEGCGRDTGRRVWDIQPVETELHP